jgi:hypothetical protein
MAEEEIESTEALAQTLHANYLAGRDRDGTYDPQHQASHRAWPELEPTYREANRAHARRVAERLASFGYEIRPAEESEASRTSGARFSFTADEIKQMAVMEHEHWCAQKIATGWSYGSARDDAGRKHPDLVPWEELDEPAREKDREPVRELPVLLAGQGLAIVRRESR